MISLARHPTNNNAVIVADLAEDIDSLVSMTSEEIKAGYIPKILKTDYRCERFGSIDAHLLWDSMC